MSTRSLLDILKLDIKGDVNGHRPLSSCNYLLVTITVIAMFTQIEAELKKRRSKLWVRVYEDSRGSNEETETETEQRLELTMLVLGEGEKADGERDEEALEVVRRVFESMRAGFEDFVYWGELEVGMGVNEKERDF
ncbi:hypothetical protein ONS95_000033 [Cadophora gregata]|uniref:uncharacterized protein n=1 Tax=Cadophora gregata TaxID=51156 RepID=UPI0026DBE1E3|nr:uncharacterized protein ONS95_000033 [Cadophora gregata]KAK0115701.1 hypothetical protein ONS96_014146 [Cadophora gregata f. sp. sojae]KAK0128047.1 hypothetical protein ONS95_000033 [Cadophora gregata]